MAYDANEILQTAVTKTATFNGSTYDLKTGTPRRGMVARFLLTSYSSVGTAGTVFAPSIQASADGTNDWITVGGPDSLATGATAASSKEIFVHFETRHRYIRPVMTLSPSSGTPSVTYLADLGISKP